MSNGASEELERLKRGDAGGPPVCVVVTGVVLGAALLVAMAARSPRRNPDPDPRLAWWPEALRSEAREVMAAIWREAEPFAVELPVADALEPAVRFALRASLPAAASRLERVSKSFFDDVAGRGNVWSDDKATDAKAWAGINSVRAMAWVARAYAALVEDGRDDDGRARRAAGTALKWLFQLGNQHGNNGRVTLDVDPARAAARELLRPLLRRCNPAELPENMRRMSRGSGW